MSDCARCGWELNGTGSEVSRAIPWLHRGCDNEALKERGYEPIDNDKLVTYRTVGVLVDE